jgi:hypothetical protein
MLNAQQEMAGAYEVMRFLEIVLAGLQVATLTPRIYPSPFANRLNRGDFISGHWTPKSKVAPTGPASVIQTPISCIASFQMIVGNRQRLRG